MPASPKVAVITRTKQRPLLLKRAMESVFSQTYPNFEWVVVNDGGEPEPVDEIVRAARARGATVSLLHHQISQGMEAASNAAIASSKSEYIVIHDDDDSWEPGFLETTVTLLDRYPAFCGIVTNVTIVFEEIVGKQVRELLRRPWPKHRSSMQIADMLRECQFPPISFLFRRAAYDEVGGFDASMKLLGDWDFELRLLERYDIGVVSQRLANYHLRRRSRDVPAEYLNTMMDQLESYETADASLRNRWLRRDLEAGRLGFGFLMTAGSQLRVPLLWSPIERFQILTRRLQHGAFAKLTHAK